MTVNKFCKLSIVLYIQKRRDGGAEFQTIPRAREVTNSFYMVF